MEPRRVQAMGLVAGPVLFALSPLFWVDGHYGSVGGMLIAVSTVPWMFGLIGEYQRLRRPLPTASWLWLLLVLIGMFGTIAFGLQGFFEDVLGSTDSSALGTFKDYPVAGAAVLLIAGPMFPTALIILGIFYWRTRSAPRWTAALLCIAAAAFPLARVVRVDAVAVGADLLMLSAFVGVAWHVWQRTQETRSPAA
ncbi:hypothetical protein [Microbacterium sp. NPDC057650]|uniref:hypothetical protein n=1 Tax=unclassified Microbacterium TaxID=2609290 RepID=UPI0036731564